MQIRCQSCQRPFALSKEAIHAALNQIDAEGQGYYGADCPHCRKMNRVSRKELQRAAPDWVRQPDEGRPDDTNQEI